MPVRDGQREVAVIGLARSGVAVARLLQRDGATVYASDAGADPAVRSAAEALRTLGVDAECGGHDLDRVARAARVVVSPGVPPNAPVLVRARAARVPVVSEVEIALLALPHTRLIAVTGTNGKSTVTALIDHLLRAQQVDSVAAGNIGIALSEIALRPNPPAVAVAELSSFQLHDTPSLAPAVGVLTNLAPDHLDRYPSVEAYYDDKALLFRNATSASAWVSNADDPEVRHRVAHVAGRHLRFSLVDVHADAGPATSSHESNAAWGHTAEIEVAPPEHWQLFGHSLLATGDLPLPGRHNVANALASVLAVAAFLPRHDAAFAERIVNGLCDFPGLPHRLQTVAERDDIVWINDSKATNVSSALVGIDAMRRPSIVLLGGIHKGEPYTALVPSLRAHAKLVIAFGEAAALIEHDLAAHVPLVRLGSSFNDVVARARAEATPGDAVLLSPACSSFDMFTNYEDRGQQFAALAREL